MAIILRETYISANLNVESLEEETVGNCEHTSEYTSYARQDQANVNIYVLWDAHRNIQSNKNVLYITYLPKNMSMQNYRKNFQFKKKIDKQNMYNVFRHLKVLGYL